MKRNAILSFVAAVAFIVASAFSFIEHLTGTKESSTWLVLGCMFFILAVPAIVRGSQVLKKAKQ